MGKVSDLEKIGREVEVTNIDRSTRSKIELTMKRPVDVPTKERKPEKQLEVPAHLTLEDHGDVASETITDTYPEAEVEPAPYLESDAAVALMASTVDSRSEPMTSAKVEDAPKAEVSAQVKTIDLPLLISISLLGAGLAMYAVDIFLTMTHTLDRVLGWGIAIAASALIAFAVMRLLPKLKKIGKEEEELVLCPVCHEVVTEATVKCPSCGVKFKETSSRE